MKLQLVLLGLSSLLVLGIDAQVPGWGRCPRPSVKSDFQQAQYLGGWYEVRSYFPILFQLSLKCVKATYSTNDDGSIRVLNEGVNTWTGKETSIVGKATVPDSNVPAKLKVSFSSSGSMAGDYWVLDTDYTRYAIVYSCTNLWFFHADILWILGREKTISEDLMDEIYEKIRAAGIKTAPITKQNQSCEDN